MSGYAPRVGDVEASLRLPLPVPPSLSDASRRDRTRHPGTYAFPRLGPVWFVRPDVFNLDGTLKAPGAVWFPLWNAKRDGPDWRRWSMLGALAALQALGASENAEASTAALVARLSAEPASRDVPRWTVRTLDTAAVQAFRARTLPPAA